MSLERDIARASRDLREERRFERVWSRHLSRFVRRADRRPPLIYNGRKARKRMQNTNNSSSRVTA